MRVINRRNLLSLLRILVLVAGLLILTPIDPGHATDGRDFAGFYDVANPTDLGNGSFRVTLPVRLFNYSDADVNDATITLSGNVDPDADYGTFSAVSIADRDSTTLRADFTVPKEEYDFWQNGGCPALWISFVDADGNNVRKKVELVFAPGEGQ